MVSGTSSTDGDHTANRRHIPPPGWHLWTSDTGVHYATRGGITAAEERAGCEATIDGRTLDELHQKLLQQPVVSTKNRNP